MRKIFLRNLIQILAPLMLCILVMGGIMLHQQYMQTVQHQRQYTNDVLYQTREAIEKNLNHVNTVAITLSYNSHHLSSINQMFNKDYLTNAQNAELDELLTVVNATVAANRSVESIYVYLENDKKNFYVSTMGRVNLKEFYDQDWYEVYCSTEPNKSLNAYAHQTTRYEFEGPRDIISVIRMLPTYQLKHWGAVVLNVDTKEYTTYLNQINLASDVKFLIRDRSGNALYCYNAGEDEVTGEELVLPSQAFEWEYVLYTSGLTIFQQYKAMLNFILITMVISSIAGLVTALLLTYHRQAKIQGVFAMLEEHGYHLRSDKLGFGDEYGYLNRHIAEILLELGQQKSQMRILQLEAAQYQMTPHFLFNTLETILFQCMDLTNSPNAASDMVSQLSKVLKYSLRAPDDQVTLLKEMEIVAIYAQIMRARYSQKFDLHFDVTPESQNCRIPKMFLQPLVENSIYHGAREKNGFTRIIISARMEGNRLLLTVADDGAGISASRLASVNDNLRSSSTNSIGLRNIYRRLETLFDQDFTMDIAAGENGGVEVHINLPSTYTK